MIFSQVSTKETLTEIEVFPEHPYNPIKIYTSSVSIALSENEAIELEAKLNQALLDLDLARKNNVS